MTGSNVSAWKEKFWSRPEEDPPWQLKTVHPKLEQEIGSLEAELRGGDKARKVYFVPCCGKSLDLKFLADRVKGDDVVIGCEGTEGAIRQFFKEQQLDFNVSEQSDNVLIFETPDKKLKIFCCDLFTLTPEILGTKVNRVWDRGSFVAFHDPETRKEYVGVIRGLLDEEFNYLLHTATAPGDLGDIDTPNSELGPTRIGSKEVESAFENFCQIRLLAHQENASLYDRLPDSLYRINVFMLTAKKSSDDRIKFWQVSCTNEL